MSTAAAVIEGEGAHFRVHGPVTMDNVQAVLEQGSGKFGAADVTIDLGGLTEVDS